MSQNGRIRGLPEEEGRCKDSFYNKPNNRIHEIMNDDRYKSREEIARIFKTKPRTVTNWTKEGCPALYTGTVQGPGHGSRPLFIVEEVEEWLKSRRRKASGENGVKAFFLKGKEGKK